MAWHGPEQRASGIWSEPRVVSWAPDRLDIFAIGDVPAPHSLMHMWWDGRAWSRWESLGGAYSTYLSAVSCRPNRLDVFTLGRRGEGVDIFGPVSLHRTWWTGQAWQGPELLDDSVTISHPCAVSWGPTRYYDVFAVGFDHTLRHWWWDSQGAGGPDVGGPEVLGDGMIYASAPVAVSCGPGRCDVFALREDRRLQHWWLTWREWVRTGQDEYEGGTHEVHGPELLGGPFYSFAAVSWGPNRLDVFADGTHKSWNGTAWSDWSIVSDPSVGPPFWDNRVTAVSWGPNRIDLFAMDGRTGLGHMWGDGVRWGGPEPLGRWYSRPIAVCRQHNRIDVFGESGGGVLYHTWWDEAPVVVTPPPPPPPPPPDPNARVKFDFRLDATGWSASVTADPNNMFVAVVPPGTDPSRAVRYPMSRGFGFWTASVPASAGGPGRWLFQCHIRGLDALGNDTGPIWSPLFHYDWQIRSPTAFLTLDWYGTGELYPQNWSVAVNV